MELNPDYEKDKFMDEQSLKLRNLKRELNEAKRKLSEIQKLSLQFPGILASRIQAILNS